MDIRVGDILTMKKQHPCGEKRWQVLRIGADKTEEIGIAHADDAECAQFLLDALRKRGFTGDCLTVCYEPVTGCHVGPGTVALFFYGVHR